MNGIKLHFNLFLATMDEVHQPYGQNILKYSNFKVFRVRNPNNRTSWAQFNFHDYVPWNERSQPRTHVDILVRPDNVNLVKSRLRSNNLTYKVLIDNVQGLFDTNLIASRLFQSPINSEGHRMTWDAYHPNEDIDNYLEFLAYNHSSIVTLENIGKSYEGRDMKVLKICKDACGHKPAIWIDGGIHAREWISPATVTYMIRKLLQEKITSPDLIDKLDWYFLPVLNPDGKYSHGMLSCRTIKFYELFHALICSIFLFSISE